MQGEKATLGATIALHNAGLLTALCLSADLPNGGSAPEWIHLLPAGEVRTVDGRGPYRLQDAERVLRESLNAAGGRMPVDENHATDLAAPKGLPAPSRGWIVELQQRDDGVWGKVEWTDEGRALVASRAYRGISPAILHDKSGRVLQILRASLVNTPNLRGLSALHHQETNMDFMKRLRAQLGLKDDADEAAILLALQSTTALQTQMVTIAKAVGLKDDTPVDKIVAGVTALATSKDGAALQAALGPIAKAAGLKEDAGAQAVLQAVTTLAAGANTAVTALQAELVGVTTQLNNVQASLATDAATKFVDDAIKRGVVGVKPLREHYIAMHAADPARVEKEINALPALGASGALQTPPENKDGKIALSAEQMQAATLLGIKPDDYRKTLEAERASAA